MRTILSLAAAFALVASFIALPGEVLASASAYRQPISVRDSLHAPGARIRRGTISVRTTPIRGQTRGVRRARNAGNRLSARSLNRNYYNRNLENRRRRSSVSERKGVIQRNSEVLRRRPVRR